MRTYENSNAITEMRFRVPATVYCPLGANYYRAVIDLQIKLDKKIVDFVDLEVFFKSEINGKHLTTEQLCDLILETMKTNYEPKYIRCEVLSDSHFEIRTIKEWEA